MVGRWWIVGADGWRVSCLDDADADVEGWVGGHAADAVGWYAARGVAVADGRFMGRLADGLRVGGPAVDTAWRAVHRGGAAANRRYVAHLVDVDHGIWVVGGLDAEAVGWAVVQGVAASGGWIADPHSMVDIGEGAVGSFTAEAATDGWVDV